MSLFRFRSLFRPGSFVPEDRLEGRAPRGIRLLPNFVTAREADEITAWIATNVAWSCSFHGNRKETYDGEPGRLLPEWGKALGLRMRQAGLFDGDPDHLHLISYKAGQGIARHMDRNILGEVIAGLTLGSSRVFEFAREGRRDPVARLLLMPGDLYTISGEARHRWEHGVPFVKEDHFGGRVHPRCEGWSATWRRIDRDAPCDLGMVPKASKGVAWPSILTVTGATGGSPVFGRKA